MIKAIQLKDGTIIEPNRNQRFIKSKKNLNKIFIQLTNKETNEVIKSYKISELNALYDTERTLVTIFLVTIFYEKWSKSFLTDLTDNYNILEEIKKRYPDLKNFGYAINGNIQSNYMIDDPIRSILKHQKKKTIKWFEKIKQQYNIFRGH